MGGKLQHADDDLLRHLDNDVVHGSRSFSEGHGSRKNACYPLFRVIGILCVCDAGRKGQRQRT